ncbi:hypothetical protein [Halorubrum halodurans]|uniref:hypothetical protein n=1 Tax=Halorubrum halodurans TaxID=1383851 RepID=UPI00117B7561|nr:hypothetical protein [Halorubrum halodurans]
MSQNQDDVTAPWWPDDVCLVTDTDLQAGRYARGQLSDPTDYSARVVETARLAEGLETASATIDRGLRVQLAYLIDSGEVSFSREDYSIEYTIPPTSWVGERRFAPHELIPREDLPDDLDPAERSIAFTTAEVVYKMLQDAISETERDTLSELICEGVERLIGQVSDTIIMRSRSVTMENGHDLRVVEWNWPVKGNNEPGSSSDKQIREYERVVCEYPIDDPGTFIVRGYKPNDDEDDPSFRDVFEMRELSFRPISIAGLGERERLTGVSSTGSGNKMNAYDEIPRDILLSLNSLGFTAVPRGQGWLDGV